MAHTINTKLTSTGSAASKSLRAFARVRRFIVNILQILVIWQERVEQRNALRELGEHVLKDIGVSHADAYKESRKPFWLP